MLEATTQIELNTALVALDLKNYDSANITEYFTAQQKLVGTVEASELTVADIQKLVDDANTKAEAGQDEVSLIKSIKDAHTASNQVAYLIALNNAGLTQVNPNWVSTPTDGYFANTDGTEADLKAIQTEINTANETILKASGTITSTGIDKVKLTASKELIAKYAPLTDTGVISDSTIKAAADAIEEQLAIVGVLEATTPTALKAKLTSLATIVNNTTTIDIKNYVDANGKAYITRLAAEIDADKDTTQEISDHLFKATTGVNDIESGGLVTAVKTAADAVVVANNVTTQDALIKALNNLGLKQVAVENKTVYGTAGAAFAAASGTGKVKKDVQIQVDTSNLAAVGAATDSTIIAKLNIFGLDNIISANAKAYNTAKGAIAGVTPDATGDNAETVKLVKAQVAIVNKAVTVAAEVKAINDAKTVAEVKSALDALADVNEVADYLKIRSADRDFVAAYVLEERPVAPGYVSVTAIAAKVTAAQGDHATALTGINALVLTSNPDDVVAALDAILDEKFDALTNVEKSAAAQAFHDQLVFDETGALKTPFVTLSAVKALLK